MNRIGMLLRQIDGSDISVAMVGVGFAFIDWRAGLIMAGSLLAGFTLAAMQRRVE